MKSVIPIVWLLLVSLLGRTQPLDASILSVEEEIESLNRQRRLLRQRLSELKLQRIQRDLRAIGLPGTDPVFHSAMALEYSEAHEQARWVAHIILPDIIDGTVMRTNDFRPDPKITTGTAVEADFFLKYLQPDSSYIYDGYGYDRGHLAPSADFRWSEKALSESYFYSNMSPQVPEFNREAWAELEALLRGYLYDHPKTQLYVVTGPLLEEDLPILKRSVNALRIPKAFFKVALDLENRTAIGFMMPNQEIAYPLESFAMTVDEVEARTGLDFYNQLPAEVEEAIESTLDRKAWLPDLNSGDASPIYAPRLPPGHFNTVQARQYMAKGEEVKVCGTVVGTRYSRSGNFWMNIDKQFPNQIFSVFIRKKELLNFSFDPKEVLANQLVCFTGEVDDFNGTPTMNVNREEQVDLNLRLK